MLAFAGIGIGYAYWVETLTVSASVGTGNLDAQFTNAFTDDDGTVDDATLDYGDDGKDPAECGPSSESDPIDRYEYDVATSSASISEEDPHTATITVATSYPGYYTTAWLVIKNTGSIPAKISDVSVENVPSALSVSIVDNPEGETIEPGETTLLGICVQVTDAADEGTSYSFSVTVIVDQFNTPN
ncbi:MAG TPA: hypothetical protein ENG16_00995 [Archaeoglobus sp.]|nr:hypothetical protein [Archaeoglobus sp.]